MICEQGHWFDENIDYECPKCTRDKEHIALQKEFNKIR